MVGAALVPETPAHLVEVGREEQGRQVLRRIRGAEGMKIPSEFNQYMASGGAEYMQSSRDCSYSSSGSSRSSRRLKGVGSQPLLLRLLHFYSRGCVLPLNISESCVRNCLCA